MSQLEADHIVKTYKDFTLQARFSIQKGSVFGIMGKNGSGKSTLIKMLSGSSFADQGVVRFLGHVLSPESFDLKKKMGYLPQESSLPLWSTPEEILSYAVLLRGLDRQACEKALAHWDLFEFQQKPIKTCSFGTQKRVGLAVATVHDPELLILDEPFSGLDLSHQKTLFREIEGRCQKGQTTLLVSHIAPYIARFCTELLFVDQGKVRLVEDWSTLSALERVERIEALII